MLKPKPKIYKQRPHIIGLRSTSKRYEPLLQKQFHKALPKRQCLDFADYVRKDAQTQWAADDQCKMIFPAINHHGDYWCGNNRDPTHPDRYKQQYCKSCQKIIYNPRGKNEIIKK